LGTFEGREVSTPFLSRIWKTEFDPDGGKIWQLRTITVCSTERVNEEKLKKRRHFIFPFIINSGNCFCFCLSNNILPYSILTVV